MPDFLKELSYLLFFPGVQISDTRNHHLSAFDVHRTLQQQVQEYYLYQKAYTGALWGSLFEVEASQVTPKAKGSLNYGNPQLQKYERKTWRSSAAQAQMSWRFPSAKQSPQCPSCLCFPPRPEAHSDALSHGAGMGDSWDGGQLGRFPLLFKGRIPMLPSHQFRCCIVQTIHYKNELNKHLF